jgi:hypothetical protein
MRAEYSGQHDRYLRCAHRLAARQLIPGVRRPSQAERLALSGGDLPHEALSVRWRPFGVRASRRQGKGASVYLMTGPIPSGRSPVSALPALFRAESS